jgi:hypothetical protein
VTLQKHIDGLLFYYKNNGYVNGSEAKEGLMRLRETRRERERERVSEFKVKGNVETNSQNDKELEVV